MRGQSACILTVSAFLFGASLGMAEAAPGLEGYWSGAGTVSYKGGADQVRCRVRYTKAGGSSYTYNSTCATENGRYEVNGKVSSAGSNRYTGSATSPDYKGQPGKVLLIQSGNRLSVTVTSGSGSAKLSFSR
jgi:hypothetical protein